MGASGLGGLRRYDGCVNSSIAERLGFVVAAVATPFVIVGLAGLLFLNPLWFAFEQGRTGVAELTGYTPAQVNQVTGSILSDLVFGPPSFDVTVNGVPVLDARERSHMVDVRTFLTRFWLSALVAAVLLVIVGVASRGRRWFWRAVAWGAQALVVGVVAVGLAFVLFFDQAFGLVHELFFPPGTYMFDPRTEKLVQLLPDQLWSETSVAIAAAVLGLALAASWLGRRLSRPPEPGPDGTVVAV